jgi:hypothetical protein
MAGEMNAEHRTPNIQQRTLKERHGSGVNVDSQGSLCSAILAGLVPPNARRSGKV